MGNIRVLRKLKSLIRDSIGRILRRFGFVLFRINSSTKPSLVEYLQHLGGQGIRLDTVFCFDSEAQIQSDLLSIFPTERVTFIAFPFSEVRWPDDLRISTPLAPKGHFLVEIDAEAFELNRLGADVPWLFEASVILIRASLGFFWSCKGDLYRIVQLLRKNGFQFFDILEYVKLHLLNAPLGRVVLVFERKDWITGAGEKNMEKERLFRIGEAVTFLSEPIAKSSDLVRLAGRGSFGFAAGILNPGAIVDEGRLILLARGEHIPWYIAKRKMTDFLSGVRPVLCELDENLSITVVNQPVFTNKGVSRGSRLEDYRLFRYGSQLFANHSVISPPDTSRRSNDPICLESLQTSVGISRVDLNGKHLAFLGNPKIDRPVGRTEKNWVFFEHQTVLYLIYSFSPYHILRANRWPSLDFETMIQQDLLLPFEADQIQIRNSANPVEYDKYHFIHMVHKAYPGKQYAFWAVLIEKKTLIPTRISSRPLICGWQSAPATIIYACAIVPRVTEILVFGNVNDSSMVVWRIPRIRLDAHWVPIE